MPLTAPTEQTRSNDSGSAANDRASPARRSRVQIDAGAVDRRARREPSQQRALAAAEVEHPCPGGQVGSVEQPLEAGLVVGPHELQVTVRDP
jgi:hypothetical protein